MSAEGVEVEGECIGGPGCEECDGYGVLDGLEPCPGCEPMDRRLQRMRGSWTYYRTYLRIGPHISAVPLTVAEAEDVLVLLDEVEALRAKVAAVEALADEWERLAGNAAWAAPYRATWQSCAGQTRGALDRPSEEGDG